MLGLGLGPSVTQQVAGMNTGNPTYFYNSAQNGTQNMPWWDRANNIFGEYGDLIGGGLGILSTGAGIWGLINSERRADKAFEHRRAMDLKNYAAQRQMYANHLESRYNINRGARQARGLDDSGYGTLAQYTTARQIPA